MDTGGEYAKPKYYKAERWMFVIIVFASAVIYAWHAGFGLMFRLLAECIFPFVLIWFSCQLSPLAMGKSGYWLNASNADTVVRICGWFILGLLMWNRLLPVFMV